MTNEAFIHNYMEGQMGRRAFIRRLVRSGVSLAAAVTYARVLQADPAAATHDGAPDLYDENALVRVSSSGLDPVILGIRRGGIVQWDFINVQDPSGYQRNYRITDPLGFIVFPALNDNNLNFGHQVATFFAAGTFAYDAQVTVKPSTLYTFGGVVESLIKVSRKTVDVGERVTVSWATMPAPAGWVYDVQVNPPGPGGFRDWKVGVTFPSVRRRLGKRGKWRFRARLRRLSDGATSGWSPTRIVHAE